MTGSPLSGTEEAHDSRREWKRATEERCDCGFACAAQQRRQVLTTCGYSTRTESVINCSEMEQLIQKIAQTQESTKQNQTKTQNSGKPPEEGGKKKPKTKENTTAMRKQQKQGKPPSGNGEKNKLLQGK